MENRRLIIYAPNVNIGGGLVLLTDLLRSLPPSKDTILFLDQRTKLQLGPIVNGFTVNWAHRSIWGRVSAEWKLHRLANALDLILCFHGIPPVFNRKGSISVYIQNRLLLGSLRHFKFPFRVRARLLYEKWVFSHGARRTDCFFVQTETMADTLKAWLDQKSIESKRPRIVIAPYSKRLADSVATVLPDLERGPYYDFCFVADGQPHKNHRALFSALRMLAKEGVFPKVAVTLGDHEVELLSELDKLNSEDQVKITNLGTLEHSAIFDLYGSSRALIFPSLIESFGLPLIEASQTGLPIIAGELNFVRDVCDPIETFDPTEPRSIARAIKRYLNLPSPPRPIMSADEFVKEWQKLERT
mgnify:CR=1 FL=1